MCGIAGAVSYICNIQDEKNAFLRMQKVLTPRGPDQDGTYFDDSCALLHTRLVVLDRENGRQPMTQVYEGNSFTLVYNGELYNTAEIRAELQSAGHTFRSHGDTEVVLKAYLEWKEHCVERFNTRSRVPDGCFWRVTA